MQIQLVDDALNRGEVGVIRGGLDVGLASKQKRVENGEPVRVAVLRDKRDALSAIIAWIRGKRRAAEFDLAPRGFDHAVETAEQR